MLKAVPAKTQNQRVLDHMIDHGYITQSIATNYGIRRLASRINDLKKEAVVIKSTMKTDDADVRYAYYTLANAEGEKIRRTAGRSWRFAT